MTENIANVDVILVPLEALTFDHSANYRLTSRLFIDEFVDEIRRDGLKEPLLISERPDGTKMVLQGHRRGLVAERIQQDFPTDWKRLFADGLPCRILTGLTHEEEVRLRIDDDGKVIANNPYEIYLKVKDLISIGASRKEICWRIRVTLDAKSKPPQALQDEIKELVRNGAEEAAVDKYWNYRRGRIAAIVENLPILPVAVEEAFRRNCIGEKTDVWVTGPEVGKLAKAWREDVAAVGENGVHPTHDLPGPAFVAAWEAQKALCAKKRQGRSTGKMSAAAVGDVAKRLQSTGLKKALLAHQGDSSRLSALAESDRLLQIAECISERDPELWRDVESRYKAIVTEQREAAKTVAPAVTPSPKANAAGRRKKK